MLLPSDVAAAVTVEKSIEKGSFYAQADPRLNHFNEWPTFRPGLKSFEAQCAAAGPAKNRGSEIFTKVI